MVIGDQYTLSSGVELGGVYGGESGMKAACAQLSESSVESLVGAGAAHSDSHDIVGVSGVCVCVVAGMDSGVLVAGTDAVGVNGGVSGESTGSVNVNVILSSTQWMSLAAFTGSALNCSRHSW